MAVVNTNFAPSPQLNYNYDFWRTTAHIKQIRDLLWCRLESGLLHSQLLPATTCYGFCTRNWSSMLFASDLQMGHSISRRIQTLKSTRKWKHFVNTSMIVRFLANILWNQWTRVLCVWKAWEHRLQGAAILGGDICAQLTRRLAWQTLHTEWYGFHARLCRPRWARTRCRPHTAMLPPDRWCHCRHMPGRTSPPNAQPPLQGSRTEHNQVRWLNNTKIWTESLTVSKKCRIAPTA